MRTRFAPSPNGALHLGHAYAAMQAHDLARQLGGAFLLRIEDIDGVRSRPELVEAISTDVEFGKNALDKEELQEFKADKFFSE